MSESPARRLFCNRSQRVIASLLCGLLLWLALVPVAAPLVVGRDHPAHPVLAEICAGVAGASRLVRLDTLTGEWTPMADASPSLATDDDPAGPQTGGHGDHCPLCSAAGHAPALLSSSPSVPSADVDAMPRLFYQARRTLFAWAATHPRGPPSTT